MTSQPMAAAKMATAELKPCPFCGEPPKAGEHRSSDESGEQYGYSYIECQSCSVRVSPLSEPAPSRFCGVHADDMEAAIAAWNKRAEPVRDAGMAAEVERLRAVLYRLLIIKSAYLLDGGPQVAAMDIMEVLSEHEAALAERSDGR